MRGKQIYLRPVRLSDVNERYVRWMNDPEVVRSLEVRLQPQSLESVYAYVASLLGKNFEPFFAICTIDGDEHIGNIKVGPINEFHRSADVSLVIGEKNWWGKGIASEAIGLITAHAFRDLGLNKLKAGCYSDNEGSARAFERNGWRREGLLRSQVLRDGNALDVILLGITADDFKELGV